MECNESTMVSRGPCDCGSWEGKIKYDDGHSYCFSCSTWFPPDGGGENAALEAKAYKEKHHFLPGRFFELKARRISEKTCRRYNCTCGKDGKGQVVMIYHYYDSKGKVIAQKVRTPDKEFYWLGDNKRPQLYGQNLYGGGGKRLYITEGEVDALTLADMLPTWAVVSIPNGAAGAIKSIQQNLEFVESYEEIVLCFDSDTPGREAAQGVAEMLTPGKVKIAQYGPFKDANEAWCDGDPAELRKWIQFDAKAYRPDGIIVCAEDDELEEAVVNFAAQADAHYPWPDLDDFLHGIRKQELVVWCAGSGIGKSTSARQSIWHLGRHQNKKVGIIALEEDKRLTAVHLSSLEMQKRIHLNPDIGPEAKRKAVRAWKNTGNFLLYDHFGSMDPKRLLSQMRYMAKGYGCEYILLDHISIVVSGLEMSEGERKALDTLMTQLRSFAQEADVGLFVISHLKRKDGTPFEEGGQISLGDLRGSGGIGQLADIAIGLERNQQAETPYERSLTWARCIKNRYDGERIGQMPSPLRFDGDSGHMIEISGGFEAIPEASPRKGGKRKQKEKAEAPAPDVEPPFWEK